MHNVLAAVMSNCGLPKTEMETKMLEEVDLEALLHDWRVRYVLGRSPYRGQLLSLKPPRRQRRKPLPAKTHPPLPEAKANRLITRQWEDMEDLKALEMRFEDLDKQRRALRTEGLKIKKRLLKRYVDFSSRAFRHKRLLPDAFEQQFESLDVDDAESEFITRLDTVWYSCDDSDKAFYYSALVPQIDRVSRDQKRHLLAFELLQWTLDYLIKSPDISHRVPDTLSRHKNHNSSITAEELYHAMIDVGNRLFDETVESDCLSKIWGAIEEVCGMSVRLGCYLDQASSEVAAKKFSIFAMDAKHLLEVQAAREKLSLRLPAELVDMVVEFHHSQHMETTLLQRCMPGIMDAMASGIKLVQLQQEFSLPWNPTRRP